MLPEIKANQRNIEGMHPKLWSSAMWRTMHCVAYAYPENPTDLDKAIYKSFFVNLGHVIPCDICSRGYTRLLLQEGGLAALDSALDTAALFEWTVDIHNSVQKSIVAKSEFRAWTADEVRSSILLLPPVLQQGQKEPPPPHPNEQLQVFYPALVMSIALCIGFLVAIAATAAVYYGMYFCFRNMPALRRPGYPCCL